MNILEELVVPYLPTIITTVMTAFVAGLMRKFNLSNEQVTELKSSVLTDIKTVTNENTELKKELSKLTDICTKNEEAYSLQINIMEECIKDLKEQLTRTNKQYVEVEALLRKE